LAINEAEEACGGSGYVTMEALASRLNTKGWAGLKSSDSKLAKYLLSDAFKDPVKG